MMTNSVFSSSDSLNPFLPPEIANRILNYVANENLVLVGGQGVLFWSHYYGLIEEHESLTRDIDFFGQRADIEDADLRLANFVHETKYAGWDDSSPNSGIILVEVPGLKNRLLIDFLWSIQGLSGSELREKAVLAKIPGINQPIHVLHPFMCLESKISNLGAIPVKRSAEGIEQARLAVQVVNSYISNLLFQDRERDALKMAERVARVASSDASNYAFLVCDVDVLNAIPVEKFTSREFNEIRYPQIESFVINRRERFSRMLPENPSPENTDRMRF